MSAAVPVWFVVLAFALFGLVFGSFANVVIWRVPLGESVVSPPSHCPGCDTEISWYDNIPLVSWLMLRGRCRACGEPISARYPVVEASSGLLFAVAAITFDSLAQAGVAACFFWFLLVLSAIDLDCMRLPNPLVAILAGLGVTGALVSQFTTVKIVPLVGLAGAGALAQPVVASALGACLGAGLSGGIAAAYAAFRGKTGLGMGDVKLLGVLGLFLGPDVLLALLIGSVLGAVAGLAGTRGGKLADRRIPFGPWLALGGVITAIIGTPVVTWYLTVSGLG